MWTALTGHSSWQQQHPIHFDGAERVGQTWRKSPDLRLTNSCCPQVGRLAPRWESASERICTGQALTHRPHRTHNAPSKTGRTHRSGEINRAAHRGIMRVLKVEGSLKRDGCNAFHSGGNSAIKGDGQNPPPSRRDGSLGSGRRYGTLLRGIRRKSQSRISKAKGSSLATRIPNGTGVPEEGPSPSIATMPSAMVSIGFTSSAMAFKSKPNSLGRGTVL